jgi:site-specific DNA-methyltransferase (adenine-specific)
VRELLHAYDDRFDDYGSSSAAPRGGVAAARRRRHALPASRLPRGALREGLLDALFGRECFLNELIWAYDYGAAAPRWPTKHDTILVYVKTRAGTGSTRCRRPRALHGAGLVSAEGGARQAPTDVWWHTIVPTRAEKTGYPTQKPEGILRRIVQASSRPAIACWICSPERHRGGGRQRTRPRRLLVDDNPEAVRVMRQRIPHARILTAEPEQRAVNCR